MSIEDTTASESVIMRSRSVAITVCGPRHVLNEIVGGENAIEPNCVCVCNIVRENIKVTENDKRRRELR
jgi:hypothetical protein